MKKPVEASVSAVVVDITLISFDVNAQRGSGMMDGDTAITYTGMMQVMDSGALLSLSSVSMQRFWYTKSI